MFTVLRICATEFLFASSFKKVMKYADETTISMPLLSICIPTFNRCNFLKRSLDSACFQNYKNKEIIISDNCSTDDTRIFVNSFIEKNPSINIQYQIHDENIGMVANWKSCLNIAKGDFFMILSDDDYLSDNQYLNKVCDLISQDQELQLISCNFSITYKDRIELSDVKLDYIQAGKNVYKNYFDPLVLGPGLFFCFYSTSTARRLDIFSENIITHDTQAMLMMSLQGTVGFVEDYCGVYDKTHEGNVPTYKYLDDYFSFEKKVLNVTSVYALESSDRKRPFKRFHSAFIRDSTWKLIKLKLPEWVACIYIFLKYKSLYFIIKNTIVGLHCNIIIAIKNRIKRASSNACI